MDYLDLLYDDLLSQGIAHPDWMLGAMAGALTAFFVGRYGGLPRFRNNRGIRPQIPSPPVSVVVVIRENGYYFIENYLPLLLGQRYDEFEVVAVDCSYDEEIGELLHEKSLACSRLHVTAIKQQRSAGHGTKLALTVGIKACAYEHIVFTTTDCYPSSDKWLSLMAKGFINGDIVIGYCGIEPGKGLANRLMRCSRLAGSVRWLSAATRSRAYRGIAGNIGYTKSLYFESRGFNYLNMEIGDDDLFIQKIATSDNVSVVMNPAATMRQVPFGGLGWWRAVRRFYAYSFRYGALEPPAVLRAIGNGRSAASPASDRRSALAGAHTAAAVGAEDPPYRPQGRRAGTGMGLHSARFLRAHRRIRSGAGQPHPAQQENMEIEQYIVSTDQQLVERALDGDTVAFEHLFNRYRDSIYQLYVQRTSGRTDDASDLLQETFVKVYLNMQRYDSRYTFGQWVYTIARNTFIDYMRRKRDDTVPIDRIGERVSSSWGGPTPEERMITDQSRARLESLLERMSPRYRKLIELRFFKEYSYEEIAAELQLPMGTVKTQIHRAREQLCRYITESGSR